MTAAERATLEAELREIGQEYDRLWGAYIERRRSDESFVEAMFGISTLDGEAALGQTIEPEDNP